MKFRSIFALMGISSLMIASCQKNNFPVSLHPENPHYFLFRGEPAVLIGSTEHYGAVLNLGFDYIPYLEELASKGLNITRTFSGIYLQSQGAFGIEKNTLAPAKDMYICPWASIIRNDSGEFSSRVLAIGGEQYLIYLSRDEKNDSSFALTIELPAGKYTGDWIDTKSGKRTLFDIPDHQGETITLNTPLFSEDIACRLKQNVNQ